MAEEKARMLSHLATGIAAYLTLRKGKPMNVLEFDQHHTAHQDASGQVVRDYLTSNGWKHTSDHPGSIWLWTIAKDLSNYDAQVYAVNESTALQFQRYWELEAQHFNSHDEFCPIFKTFDWDDCNCMVAEAAASPAGP